MVRTSHPLASRSLLFKEKQAKAHHLGVPVKKDVDTGDRVNITMVLIPPGEFLIGSAVDDLTTTLTACMVHWSTRPLSHSRSAVFDRTSLRSALLNTTENLDSDSLTQASTKIGDRSESRGKQHGSVPSFDTRGACVLLRWDVPQSWSGCRYIKM